MPLTDAKCRYEPPQAKLRKLVDGGGLQLWVQPSGSRFGVWPIAFRVSKSCSPSVSTRRLAREARQARDQARRLLEQGLDPSAERKRKAQLQADAPTFRASADEYVAKLKREARAEATLAKTEWLLTFANSEFGDEPIRTIGAPAILHVLQSLEARERFESARRLRSTIGSVFRYAIATARAELDPTYALKGALTQVKATPRAAITDRLQFGALLRAIDAFDGQHGTRIALQLLTLLFPRPGELRLATWSEFDFERAVWSVPAARMKMRRPHRVPLSIQAIGLLETLRRLSSADLLFPSVRSDSRPISDGTLNAALRRLGYGKDEVTAHGFRATASSLLNEFRRLASRRDRTPTRPCRGERHSCGLCPRRPLGPASVNDAMVGRLSRPTANIPRARL